MDKKHDEKCEINQNFYDFWLFFDTKMGILNGDSDNEGNPRMPGGNEIGMVTHYCIKRWCRDYIDIVKAGEPGYDIFVKSGIPLERNINRFLDNYGLTVDSKFAEFAKKKKELKDSEDLEISIAKYMGENYFDVRAFGEPFTSLNGKMDYGQVKGLAQIENAISVSKIKLIDVPFTRCTVTREKDATKERVISSKQIVQYGLYKCKGSITPNFGRKNVPLTKKDIELLWQALLNMLDLNPSSRMGEATTRKLVIFKHDSKYGNARWSKLEDRIKVEQIGGDYDGYPTCYNDFKITVDTDNLPKGVSCEILD